MSAEAGCEWSHRICQQAALQLQPLLKTNSHYSVVKSRFNICNSRSVEGVICGNQLEMGIACFEGSCI
jgi:hypothetical protein